MGKIVLRLDRVMADRKMSLNQLSEIVGVSNVNLSKMKTGKISAIRFSTLEAICDALACQPGDILEYDPNAQSDSKTEE
ncbi:MAG: helix-turn-helix transcriptional regulator [Lachnospiraceae bacterium]|nr:helix-turn-helix transcriptional regulator [Lachnospiraceae bacterium]